MADTTSAREERDGYTLKRDCNASSRLTAQHYLWKDALGFLLHPSIPVEHGNPLAIADIATGNGIWLLDLAAGLPESTTLHGFDVSLDQAGPPEWNPPNVFMHTWNIFDEPASAFVGAFDIVHVRLITVVVRNNSLETILDHLWKILKPGGYLQWDEVDSNDCYVNTVSHGKAESLKVLLGQLSGTDLWKHDLKDTLQQSGFRDSHLFRFEYILPMARFWNDIYVSTWKELAQRVFRTPTDSAALEAAAMDEVRGGASVICPKLVWVTQKR